ncbi:MAG: transposase, partial [Bacteroidetes bacterium]|nr:transposase [Bacteroidota bacterium]
MEAIQSGQFTLKQILQENWCSFLDVYHLLVQWYAAYNVWKVINCREPDGLGYATFACPVHPSEISHVPRSCKSRFCSVCAKVQIDRWVTDMNRLFPNCSYFHITFTVPTQFRTLLFEKRSLLNAVFSASTGTIVSFCKERGFLPAVTAVLHTFGSDLKRHIHIHCIVSAGGLKLTGKAERFIRFAARKKKNPKAKKKNVSVVEDNPSWVECHFFPYKMLQKRYQTLLLEHLKKAIENNIKSFEPDQDLLVFSNPAVVKSFFDELKHEYQNGFFVHVTEERQDLQLTAGYIGRYARRPPLSELRIKNYTSEYVTFQFKDYRHNGSKVLYTLKTIEFIKKLIRHIPPHYFNVIRHYGLLASRVKAKYKEITDKLLATPLS